MTDLEVLEKLEKKYANWFNRYGWYRKWNKTNNGLCHALTSLRKIFDHQQYNDVMPLLKMASGAKTSIFYWYPKGEIEPRLKCVRKAIKIKKLLDNGEEIIGRAAARGIY